MAGARMISGARWRAEYETNFRKAVLNSLYVEEELRKRGARVMAAARESTPVGDGRGEHIRSHYKMKSRSNGGVNNDRIEVTVYNDHPAAIAYELGWDTENGRHVKAANKLSGALWAARS